MLFYDSSLTHRTSPQSMTLAGEARRTSLSVTHIITGLARGGAETMLVKLIAEHTAMGIKSDVICLSSDVALKEAAEVAGATVTVLGSAGRLSALKKLGRLNRMVRDNHPDLIQGWMVHGNFVSTCCALLGRLRVPVLWNVRWSGNDLRIEKVATRLATRFSAFLSHQPRVIVYNSRSGAEQHRRFGYCASNAVVIPNGFNCAIFQPDRCAYESVRRELGIPMDGLVIGCSARYHPMKDHRTLLRAAALLSSHRDGVHFVLAGRGVDPSNRELLAAVRSLGLELQVHLLGERQDMPRITAAFDIGTSSSQSNEGFSNAVGEAMACGVPCVVTDIGDSAFLVGDTGIVIPPLNPEALSNAWIRLVDMDRSSRESLGRAARQRIEGQFSISAVAAEYARIYEEVRRSGQSAGCP